MIRLARTRVRGSRDGGEQWERSWHVDTEAEILDCVRANRVYNGFEATGDWEADNWEPDTTEAGYLVTIRYGAVTEDVNGPEGGEYGGEVAIWDFEPGFEKKPVEAHPLVTWLIDNYGGTEDPSTGRVTFSRTLPELPREDARALLGRSYRDASGEIRNPLYGLNESGYLALGGVATARYKTTDIESVMNDVGRVFTRLPANAPVYEVGDRNWLKAPPRVAEIAREENGRRWYEVVHQFLLSDLGGWPPGVYNLIEI